MVVRHLSFARCRNFRGLSLHHKKALKVRAACLQNETDPEKLLNRYEKRFEKREKGSEKQSETCLNFF